MSLQVKEADGGSGEHVRILDLTVFYSYEFV